tara:strand:- start:819 stop:1661 length:843 start_codon:yes stop_codon:yes gene_type:complete
MTYETIAKECEKLSYRDKFRLAQLLIQQARKEEEKEHSEKVEPKLSPKPDHVSYVTQRLLKLKPVKKSSLSNAISAIFQSQGGISEAEKEKLISELQKNKTIIIGETGRVSYAQATPVFSSHDDLPIYYCVDDLPGAHIPATRLTTILERLQKALPLGSLALTYLEKQGLRALHRHANGDSTADEFREAAKAEQHQRMREAEVLKLKRVIEQREREAARQAQMKQVQEKAKAARLALERDPKHIAKIKNQKLRASYELDLFIKQDCFATLMDCSATRRCG